MPNLHTPEGAIYLLQTLVSAFLAILFLQSGIDKVVDRRGNLEWLTGHFAKSPLAGLVPLMLSVITLLELTAGGLSAVGCVLILVLRGSWGLKRPKIIGACGRSGNRTIAYPHASAEVPEVI